MENHEKYPRRSILKRLGAVLVGAALSIGIISKTPEAKASGAFETEVWTAGMTATTGLTGTINGYSVLGAENYGSGNGTKGLYGHATNGIGILGSSNGAGGWAIQGLCNSAFNAQFKNSNIIAGTDRSTLVQLLTGDDTPTWWNIGAAGAHNGLGLASGRFYIENSYLPRMVIDTSGNVGIGAYNPARSIHLLGSNACFRMDRNQDSAAFILVRTAAGNFNEIWKTFYVGVDATKVNTGEFFIGDVGTSVSGPSTKRLRIYDNGDVWVQNLLTGDVKLANDFIVTEDEKLGIAFKNDAGEKIAVLDRQGNFHIKGDVIKDL